MQAVIPVIREALENVPGGLSSVDAIAVTQGPGLVGSLLVGVQVAKALAWSLDKPLVGVNHLDGHLFAIYLRRDDAAGEAFDKAAKLLGLGYPGGPIIDKLAAKGEAGSIAFPMPMASRSERACFRKHLSHIC